MQNRKMIVPFITAALLSAVSISSFAQQPPAEPTGQPGMVEKAGVVVEDSVITTKVKSALVADKDVSALKINVTTKQGVVMLTGAAPTVEAIKHVLQLVAAIDGVKDIESHLQVKAS
ncbi:BON domain-containing protein [Solimicrobium silvestre]|uniref:BON domain n=1 Tax=Solimicrobium silvestre TaxID=2099400 RepID=A0A2S9H022_9BURK|nr:BON domain-containing protein [Solimicrobium silvestre]PRC93300.1 BON domain [Solimicrobium silvestre]